MGKTIILYQSKYGATKQYAEWLSQKLECDMIETKSAKINDLAGYDTIILGGGIYANGIAGISFLKKNYSALKDKKVAVFAVGASPYDKKAMDGIIEHNLKGDMAGIPCFYCRGAWKESLMTFRDRTLCKMLKSSLAKKDSATYEPWEAALVDAIGSDADFTDEDSLAPILEFVHGE